MNSSYDYVIKYSTESVLICYTAYQKQNIFIKFYNLCVLNRVLFVYCGVHLEILDLKTLSLFAISFLDVHQRSIPFEK